MALSDAEIKDFFNAMDENGDGTVTAKEIVSLLEKFGKDVCPDPAGDAKAIIKECDVDGDSKVTWEEFKKAWDNCQASK